MQCNTFLLFFFNLIKWVILFFNTFYWMIV